MKRFLRSRIAIICAVSAFSALAEAECVNLTGDWEGACRVVTAGEPSEEKVSFPISQKGCERITLSNLLPFSIGGKQSFRDESNDGSSELTFKTSWNQDKSKLNQEIASKFFFRQSNQTITGHSTVEMQKRGASELAVTFVSDFPGEQHVESNCLLTIH